jgi:hypothetical protein
MDWRPARLVCRIAAGSLSGGCVPGFVFKRLWFFGIFVRNALFNKVGLIGRRRVGPVPFAFGHSPSGAVFGCGIFRTGRDRFAERVEQGRLAGGVAESRPGRGRVKGRERVGPQDGAGRENIFMVSCQTRLQGKTLEVKTLGVGIVKLDEFVGRIVARSDRIGQ